jgi:hypothetical protein
MKRLIAILALVVGLAIALAYVSRALQLEHETAQFRALPYHDFVRDAERLAADGRLAEARSLLDFVIENPDLPRQKEAATLRRNVQAEMDSWLAKAKRLGKGALTGRGQNAEEIIGAIGADMFVVGDVRDLCLQAWRYATGGDADPVVAALSVIGLATTVAPEVDWAPAFLKLARKTGAMTKRFAGFLLGLARSARKNRSAREALECLRDTERLVERTGPSGALRMMRSVENGQDLKAAAQFAQASPHAACAVVSVGGNEALRLLERTGIEEGADIAIEGAKRGHTGVALASRIAPQLFRAHFCVGAAKAVWKRNLNEAITLALSRLGQAWLRVAWGLILLALLGVLAWALKPWAPRASSQEK